VSALLACWNHHHLRSIDEDLTAPQVAHHRVTPAELQAGLAQAAHAFVDAPANPCGLSDPYFGQVAHTTNKKPTNQRQPSKHQNDNTDIDDGPQISPLNHPPATLQGDSVDSPCVALDKPAESVAGGG
jgi:hypothetical protein